MSTPAELNSSPCSVDAAPLPLAEAVRAVDAKKRSLASFFQGLFADYGASAHKLPLGLWYCLQSPEVAPLYVAHFGERPTLAVLKTQFALTDAAYAELVAAKQQWDAQSAEPARTPAPVYDCLLAAKVPAFLGITKAEFEAWRADGRIPTSGTVPFHKGGKEFKTTIHHPAVLRHITPVVLAAWRAEDVENHTLELRARKDAASFDESLHTALANLRASANIEIVAEGKWDSVPSHQLASEIRGLKLRFGRAMAIPVTIGEGVATSATVMVEHLVDKPGRGADFLQFQAEVCRLFDASSADVLAQNLSLRLTELVEAYQADYRADINPTTLPLFYPHIAKELPTLRLRASNLEDANSFGAARRSLGQGFRQVLLDAKASALLRLEDCPLDYPVARSLKRTVHFRMGPTNSGKTHGALERLAAAPSGVYLAAHPLQAIAARNRLWAAGIPCNLLTDTEQDIIPGAQHTAAIIEQFNPTTTVAVAVVDDCHLLADARRGWAWTAALLGVPAKEVYACGLDSVLELCQRAITHLEEEHHTTITSRLIPLTVEAYTVPLTAVQKGDALLASNRDEVLALRDKVKALGLTVATLYEELPPEVLHQEARRMSTGEADVALVAMAALELGVDLPIRRVVFTESIKLDGKNASPLIASAVQQIAGRAGRVGRHSEGLVAATSGIQLAQIRRILTQAPSLPLLARMPVAANARHITQLSQLLEKDHLPCILAYFAEKIVVNSPLFTADALVDARELSYLTRNYETFTLPDRYALAGAPRVGQGHTSYGHCLNAVEKNAAPPLLKAAKWITDERVRNLAQAELLSRRIATYIGVARQFPANFPQMAELAELRHTVHSYIERVLRHPGPDSGYRRPSANGAVT